MRRLVFTIGPDGKISADANGFKGEVCIKDTAKALAGLDTKMETQTKKAEYLDKVQIKETIRCGEE
jgi:hypothetical protein